MLLGYKMCLKSPGTDVGAAGFERCPRTFETHFIIIYNSPCCINSLTLPLPVGTSPSPLEFSISLLTFELLGCGIHHGLSAAGGAKNLIVFIISAVVEHRLFEVVLHLARSPVGTFKLKNVVLDEGRELFLKLYHVQGVSILIMSE